MTAGRIQGRRQQTWDILLMPTTDELDTRLRSVERSQGVILEKLDTIVRITVTLVVIVVAHLGVEFLPVSKYSDLTRRIESVESRALLEPKSD